MSVFSGRSFAISSNAVCARSALRVDEIHDRALVLTEYPRVWIGNEIADRRGVPVIPARQTVLIVQALLHYGPLAF